jgi:hypothetical protein
VPCQSGGCLETARPMRGIEECGSPLVSTRRPGRP